MVDYFDRIYTSIENKNSLLVTLRFYSLQRFLIRKIANFIIPWFFRLSNRSHRSISINRISGNQLIISLTTFPARINKLWIVMETLFRQDVLPDRIILWLSNEQFKDESRLPKSLLKFKKRGLEIRFVDDDIRSHKKYLYAMKEFPNDYIITVDDDLYYPTDLLSQLIKFKQKYENCICCNRGYEIIVCNHEIQPYRDWKELKVASSPNFKTFFTSGGGTLFPPSTLYADVFNVDILKEVCFHADDIWLNAMAQLAETQIVKTNFYSEFLPVSNVNNVTLSSINVGNGMNDKQIQAIRKFYKHKLERDPFSKVLNS